MRISPKNAIRLLYAGLSDVGLQRSENQDSFGQFPVDSLDSYQSGGLLFIVADGMGGHENGKEASHMAVSVMADEYYAKQDKDIEQLLNRSIQTANATIFQKASTSSHQMGTTLSALVVKENLAHIAHVGDSRIYLIREGMLRQLTTDHTKVEELKRAGIINKEEAKNHPEKSVLHRALGIKEQVRVDLATNILVKPADIFVLCSDGIALVKKDELVNIVRNETPQSACQKIIALANSRGGHDNSTVQVVKIEKEEGKKKSSLRKTLSGQILLWLGLALLTIIFVITTIYISVDYASIETKNISVKTEQDQSAPNEINDLHNRAKKFVKDARYDEAIQIYQQILVLNPLDLDALKELNRVAARFIRIAEEYEKTGNIEESLNYYRQAKEIRLHDIRISEIIKNLENH